MWPLLISPRSLDREILLTKKLLNQKLLIKKLKSTLQKTRLTAPFDKPYGIFVSFDCCITDDHEYVSTAVAVHSSVFRFWNHLFPEGITILLTGISIIYMIIFINVLVAKVWIVCNTKGFLISFIDHLDRTWDNFFGILGP